MSPRWGSRLPGHTGETDWSMRPRPRTAAGRSGFQLHATQPPTGRDVELGEDLAKVPFDGSRTQEQPLADLGVGETVPGQPGDEGFLRGQAAGRGFFVALNRCA